MVVQTSSKKSKSATYNFALDTGAIATYQSGIFVPARSVITRFFVKVITAPLSGGAATVQWDLGAIPLLVPSVLGGFVVNTAVVGIDFNINPTFLAAGTEVTFGIAVAVLTAGFIMCTIDYTEYSV